MIPLSPDEQRIYIWMQKRAVTYNEAADKNPFSFHRVRAKLCEKIALAIAQGKHR